MISTRVEELTIEELILDFGRAFLIQLGNMILEALPLGLLLFRVILRIGIVLALYQTKVCGCLSKISKRVAKSEDQIMIMHT